MALGQFAAQLVIILSIIVGFITILKYLGINTEKEKVNAVEIANLKKDVEAQKIAAITIRDEMRSEVNHLQSDIREVKDIQKEIAKDIRTILKQTNS